MNKENILRVLVVAPQPFFEERGTPIAVRWLVETLLDFQCGVDLIVYPFGQDVSIMGLSVVRSIAPLIKNVGIGFSWQKLLCDFFLFFTLACQIFTTRYDVIHAGEESVFLALLLKPFYRAKLVYDMDSSLADQLIEQRPWLKVFRPMFEAFEKFAIRHSDLVLPVCDSLAEKARYLVPDANIVILRDMAMETKGTPAQGEDIKKGLLPNKTLSLYVGNLEEYQGIDLMLEALVAGADISTELVLIGGTPEALSRYQQKVRDLGLTSRVRFLGPRPFQHLQYYLAQADILISPRIRGKNTPMKIYSYMLAGKPILATCIASHTQVLDSNCAVLVAPDPKDMAEAWKALSVDAQKRKELGEKSLHRAQARHTLTSYHRAVQEAYHPFRSVRSSGASSASA